MTDKTIMLTYLAIGLGVILFMMIGLHSVALFLFGFIIGSIIIKLIINVINYLRDIRDNM